MIAKTTKTACLLVACLTALTLAPAHAASTVRSIQSAGVARLQSVPTGRDGLQSPEFAPTFANLPGLQDGPDAGGSGGDAHGGAQQARTHIGNRTSARRR